MRDASVELPMTVALVATATFAEAADYRGLVGFPQQPLIFPLRLAVGAIGQLEQTITIPDDDLTPRGSD